MNNISEGDESPSPFHVNVVVWTDYYKVLTIAPAYDTMQTIPKKGNKKGRCLGMVWYWFTARKNGKHIRERIPADSQTEAVSELEKMGYTDIVITDIVIAE